jgi:hypothetical protein
MSADEQARLPRLDEAIATSRKELLRARDMGLEDRERVFNVGLYILLMDRDFAVVKLQMATFDKWKLRFSARQMAVIIYEVVDDLSGMLGKPLRQSFQTLGISEDDRRTLEDIGRALNQFRKGQSELPQ